MDTMNTTPTPPGEYAKTNIFISYAHAQSQVVEDIVDGLRDRGYSVWFDEKDIHHGDDWRASITDGIEKSNGVLSFLSQEAIRDGGVCLDELGIAVGVKYGNIRTILLQKEKELQPIPAQLTHRQWLDMSDWKDKLDQGEAIYRPWLQDQLETIIGMIESYETKGFIGDINLIREKLNIDDIAISKQSWYLRQPFVGRKWLTEKIEKWLDDPNGGHLCAVYGGPGTGKSAFAAQYVYRSPRAAASLFFEHGNTYFNSPDAIVRELIFQLACRLPQYRSRLVYKLQEQSTERTLNTQELFQSMFAVPLHEAIDGGHETLCVVIDGLDECGEDGKRLAAQLLSEEKFPNWLRVVVLTRPENTVTANLKPDMEIRMEEDEDANREDVREYFLLRLENLLMDHPDKDKLLDRLTENADGVFLYAYIVTDMILKDKLSLDKPKEYPRDLNMSFEAWFSRYFPDADEFNRLYKLPLGILAACSEPIPVEELDMLNARYDPYECTFVLTEPNRNVRRQSVVKRLERCAVLLKYSQDDFEKRTVEFTHRYIGEWMTKTDEATGQSASRTYFCAPADVCWVLEKTWRQKLERGEKLTDYEALHLLDMMRQTEKMEEVTVRTDSNIKWVRLLYQRYKQFDKDGKPKICLLFAEAMVDLSQYVFGKEHPETLTAMNNLAYTYNDLGHYEHALKIQEQVYALRCRVLGEDHPDTLSAKYNLAVYNYYLAVTIAMIGFQCKKAEPYAEEAYQLFLQFGEENSGTLFAAGSLAWIYRYLARYEEALRIGEKTHPIMSRVLGEEHSKTLAAKRDLALTYVHYGRYEEALKLQERVYSIMSQTWGEEPLNDHVFEHMSFLSCMEELANTYDKAQKYEDEITLRKKICGLAKITWGEESYNTLTRQESLADAYCNAGLFSDALKLQTSIYYIYKEKNAGTDYSVLKIIKDLSYTNYKLGRYKTCAELYLEAIKISRKRYGEESGETAKLLGYLATCYNAMKQYEQELPLREKAHKIICSVYGEEHADTLAALSALSEAYYHLEQYESCIPLDEKAAKLTEKLHGGNSAEMVTALENLAMDLQNLKQYKEELPLRERIYALREELLGEKDPDTLRALQFLSWAYYNLEHYEKCIPLDMRAIEITELIYGTDSLKMATALNDLSIAYSKLNCYADALPLMERAYELRLKLLGSEDPLTIKARERLEEFRNKAESHSS